MIGRLAQLLALSGIVWAQVPQPVLTGISPNPVSPTVSEGPQVTLALSGAGFCQGAQLLVQNTSIATQFVSATSLRITAPALQGFVGDLPVRVSQVAGQQCPNPGQSQPFTLTVLPPIRVVTPAVLPEGIVGTPYSVTLQSAGGVPPVRFNTSSGGLATSFPPGLSVNFQTGVLAGTPTVPGTYDLALRVEDGLRVFINTVFRITIRPALQITSGTLPAGLLATPYSQALSATGGQPPYIWGLIAGAPPGLQLSSNGVLSGTPTQAGQFNVQVRMSDSANREATTILPLTILAPALQITTSSLPRAIVGGAYVASLTATGGVAPYLWSTAGPLPAGIVLSTAGVLSGVTQQGGSFTPAFTVRDAAGQTATATLTLNVTTPLQITTATIPPATLGTAYSTFISASGGTAPYTWSAPAGMPAGFQLDPSSGILSGSTLTEGAFNLTVQVGDAAGQLVSRAFTLAVGNALSITTSFVPNATVGLAYEQTFTASGGNAPYLWTVVGPNVPGLILNLSTGSLSGTPTLAGNFNLTVRVTDSANVSSSRSFSITINPSFLITTTSLPPATLGAFYEQTFAASGGSAPYTWTLSGTPAPGLSLNANGTLSGVPNQAGSYSFLIVAADSLGQQTTKSFNLVVNQGVRVGPDTLSGASVGTAYTVTFTAAGGTPPYSFVTVGSVPGLSLNTQTGVWSGTPSQAGTFPFTIRATDAAGLQGTQAYSLNVLSNLSITTASLADAVQRGAYSQTLSASGGTPPLVWRIASGTLPAGLALSAAAGVISGTPNSPGRSDFTVEVSDSLALKATRSLSINVLPGLVIESPTALPAGVAGSSYTAALQASGGTAPYRWRLRDGALPTGLILADTGQITGTPTVAGRSDFSVEVSDVANRTANGDVQITITQPLLQIISATQLPDATAGVAYQFTAAAAGGTAPYRWALSGAPADLAIDPNSGVLSGRLSTAGALQFSIRVTDSIQTTASQSVSLRVALPAAPTAVLSGVPATGQPALQISPLLRLGQQYPLNMSGELNLAFSPAAGVDDPAVQFSTGGRRIVFNIPAGATDASFNADRLGVQTGTVAGTINLAVRLSAGGSDITPSPAPGSSLTIPRLAPVINSLRVNRTATGFDLLITAYSTAREINTANVRLQTTGTVQGTDFAINLAPAVTAWYQNRDSAQFGSLCTMTIPFTIQGAATAVSGLSVTLTNSIGTSSSVSTNF